MEMMAKSYANYVQFLVKLMQFRFKCGEEKLGWNVKNSTHFVQDYLKIFLVAFACLKAHENSQMFHFLVGKSRTSSLILPWCKFSTKFLLDAKMQNSAFSNISGLGLCCYSVAVTIDVKSEEIFWNTKIYWRWKLKESRKNQIRMCFLRQSWAKDYGQIYKIR